MIINPGMNRPCDFCLFNNNLFEREASRSFLLAHTRRPAKNVSEKIQEKYMCTSCRGRACSPLKSMKRHNRAFRFARVIVIGLL